MLLLVKNLLDLLKGLFRNGDFSFKKRKFSTVNFSKRQANFDPRPSLMKNLNPLFAAYT